MKVLIGCEESQTECLAFRSLGIEAYSCDIKPTSGSNPEWNIQCDLRLIDFSQFDLAILHPPCTYLTVAGARHMFPNGSISSDRYQNMIDARAFFLFCYNLPIAHICVENPVPMRICDLPEYSQIIDPYLFGDPFKKRTCLWLRNLPLLQPTNIVEPLYRYIGSTNHCSGKRSKILPGCKFKSADLRFKSFPGIASAMAAQWGNL